MKKFFLALITILGLILIHYFKFVRPINLALSEAYGGLEPFSGRKKFYFTVQKRRD